MNTKPCEIVLAQAGVPEAPEPAPAPRKVRARRRRMPRVKRPRPIFVFGLCRLGLFLMALAHVLLVAATVLTLVTPWTTVGKVCALAGYLLLCGVVLNKVYRVMTGKAVTRKPKKPTDPAHSQATILPTLTPPESAVEHGAG